MKNIAEQLVRSGYAENNYLKNTNSELNYIYALNQIKELMKIILHIHDSEKLTEALTSLKSKLKFWVGEIEEYKDNIKNIELLFDSLQEIKNKLIKDNIAIYNNDPAADSVEQVRLVYNSFKAIVCYRFANVLYKLNYRTLARMLSEYAHSHTGVDIHPGAEIGEYFAIDHGTGIVIGESTVIENNVTIYQGVTLGALHLDHREQRDTRRHPTIKNNVVIYANATILGGDTVIGEGSIIGASAFVYKSVEPGSKVRMGDK